MKVLGIVFSSRADGNCSNAIKYCLDKMKDRDMKLKYLIYLSMIYKAVEVAIIIVFSVVNVLKMMISSKYMENVFRQT